MFDNLLKEIREKVIDGTINEIFNNVGNYAKLILPALLIIIVGIIVAYLTYKVTIYLFKKFKIISLIDRFTMVSIYKKDEEIEIEKDENQKKENKQEKKEEIKKISDNIKIDVITAKSLAYYIFLIFFRYSIIILGIDEVETFLDSLVEYLPNLFIGVVILFFGFRFSNFIYDLIFYPLDLGGQQNAKIIAIGGKIIIMFFTIMIVLNKIGVQSSITDTIFKGVMATIVVAGGLAFGLGGKDLAKDILESFRTENKVNKTTKK